MEITINDELYPERLKEIKNPPEKLYVIGNEKILNNYGIAVVGSRSYSQYGEKMCKTFTKKLVEYDLTIISGMAKGIDKIAHEEAIKNYGKTIAVLPCGFNNIYPKENTKLFYKIIENGGAIITEYEPNVEPSSKSFLERNRIVSGLAIGTLVVEAGYRSGTSVTARITHEQGKKVFCIPSSLDNKRGLMTNILIQKGGKLVTSAQDILKEYENLKFEKNCNNFSRKDDMVIDDGLKDIYKIIKEIPISINEIMRKTNKNISEVNSKLMLLEMDDKIIELPGEKYIRNYE